MSPFIKNAPNSKFRRSRTFGFTTITKCQKMPNFMIWRTEASAKVPNCSVLFGFGNYSVHPYHSYMDSVRFFLILHSVFLEYEENSIIKT